MFQRINERSFQSAILQLFGAAVGVLSTLFIYPRDLNLYGIYGFLTNTASLLVPFISMGFGSVLLRFYPKYQHEDTQLKNGFFGFVLAGYSFGFLLFGLVFIGITWFGIHWVKEEGGLSPFVFYLLPFTFMLVFYELTAQLCINFQKIQWTAIAGLLLKCVLPTLFVLQIAGFLGTTWFIWCLLLYYALSIVVIIYFLIQSEGIKFQWNRTFMQGAHRRPLFQFAAFSVLSGASSVIALRMDSFFVGSLTNAESSGLFTLAMFMSNVVFIPATAITDAMNPSVSKCSHDHDSGQLQILYRKSSINMLWSTALLVIVLWICFEPLSRIMPQSGKILQIEQALLFLLLARLLDAGTGINHHLLAYSRHYRFELYLLILMAVVNVLLNIWLIPTFGITGAALATFISIGIYNLLKTWVVWKLLKIHPFDLNTFKIIIIGLVLWIFFPRSWSSGNDYLDLVLYAGAVCSIYLGLVYWMGCSNELNGFVHKYLHRFGKQAKTR